MHVCLSAWDLRWSSGIRRSSKHSVRMYVSKFSCVYVCVLTYACIHVCQILWMCACMHVCMYVCVYTTDMYIHTHTHIYIYIYIYMRSRWGSHRNMLHEEASKHSARVCVCVCYCVFVCLYVYIYIYIYICMSPCLHVCYWCTCVSRRPCGLHASIWVRVYVHVLVYLSVYPGFALDEHACAHNSPLPWACVSMFMYSHRYEANAYVCICPLGFEDMLSLFWLHDEHKDCKDKRVENMDSRHVARKDAQTSGCIYLPAYISAHSHAYMHT